MIVGRSSTFQGENPSFPVSEQVPSGPSEIGLRGNANPPEDVYNDRFLVESGADSNVVVTISKDSEDDEKRTRVKIDVYYV